jgi:lipopolysaccharide export system permease protein
MIIKRYITREVMVTLFGVVTVLMLAFLSQQVVRYLNFIVIGKIPTDVLLEMVSFEIPYLLAMLLPLALYLGILLVYGRLYAENEMAIMQMNGFAPRQLLRLTAMIGIFISAIILVLMLWVNPAVSAKRQQVMASDGGTLHLVQTMSPGRFQVSPDGKQVMYVGKLSRDRERAENVFMAQEKANPNVPGRSSWTLVYADQGYQASDKATSDSYFVTKNGYRYEGTPGENNYKIIQYEKYAVRVGDASVSNVTNLENEALTTSALWHDYKNPKRAAELQWRFSVAISALLLALLAVPLSTLQPRKGRYLVIMPAIIVYVIYINILSVARHWLEQGNISVAIGMWWVHGVMLLAIFLVLFCNSKIMGVRQA